MITVHADIVGSLLRPPELLRPQEQLSAGKIDSASFKEIEDRPVYGADALQLSGALPAI